jgi:hypothetical protein
MADDDAAGIYRWYRTRLRREYLRQHAMARRAALKDSGARRIDVTLNETDLANYEQVRQSLEELNRLMVERGVFDRPRTLPDGSSFTIPSIRLSDTEIIKAALRLACFTLENERK